MTVQHIDAREAQRMVEAGTAMLVDIREPMEHAREKIPGAKSAPLSKIADGVLPGSGACPAVIFHCQGGNRTNANLAKLEACGSPEIYVMQGGLNAWKAAGFDTNLDRSKPIEMQRQVQIAAGSLVLIGLVLAATISPWFAGISAFIGAGLTFAGISGWCGMARLLALMPWNRVPA